MGFRTLPKHAATPAAPADRNLSELDLLVRRIRAEFHEMPGLSLTVKQGARLFGVSEEVCAQILSALIGDGFLQCTTDGRYARAAVGH